MSSRFKQTRDELRAMRWKENLNALTAGIGEALGIVVMILAAFGFVYLVHLLATYWAMTK